MAITELFHILHAANTILDRAAQAVKLPKRSALALAIMSADPREDRKIANRPAFTNKGLHDRLVRHKISTKESARKDSSTAKGELIKAGYIEIVDTVSTFAITDAGKKAVGRMHEVMGMAIDALRPTEAERAMLRELVGLPPPTRPASPQTGNRSSPKQVEKSTS